MSRVSLPVNAMRSGRRAIPKACMDTYCKLYSSIVTSTIWCEDDATLRVWVAMLAVKDLDGIVHGSVPGFANLARVSIDAMRKAIDILSSPDPYSRTQDHDGRRIEAVEGGWRVLNHEKHRDRGDTSARRLQNRMAKQRERDRKTKTTTDIITDDDETDSRLIGERFDSSLSVDLDADVVRTAKRKMSRADDVLDVFAHYRKHHPKSHPKPNSKSKEWRAIKARLDEGHSVELLKAAIDGMHRTPHNLGENERGQKYLGLELCMRDASRVQRFAETTGPPRRETHDERVLRELAEHNNRCDNDEHGSESSGLVFDSDFGLGAYLPERTD